MKQPATDMAHHASRGRAAATHMVPMLVPLAPHACVVEVVSMVLIVHIATFKSIPVERGAWHVHWGGEMHVSESSSVGSMFLTRQINIHRFRSGSLHTLIAAWSKGPSWESWHRQTCQLLMKGNAVLPCAATRKQSHLTVQWQKLESCPCRVNSSI